MTTNWKDTQVLFSGVSIGNFESLSLTASAGANIGGFSITKNFAIATQFDPTAATADEVRRVLATLIYRLCKPA